MIIYEKKAAIKAFYYVLAADGDVSDDELTCYREIGMSLDKEHFDEYSDEVEGECRLQISRGIDEEDHYELMLEAIDKILEDTADSLENGITAKHLVWNMLVIAYSNGEYAMEERKIIKHISRISEIDKSVFLEMEEIIKAGAGIERELDWLRNSDRPYAAIGPHVTELERRQKVIVECAQQLIADEYYTPLEKLETKENKVYEGMAKLGGVIAEGTDELGKKTAAVTKKATADLGRHVKKLFSDIRIKTDSKEVE